MERKKNQRRKVISKFKAKDQTELVRIKCNILACSCVGQKDIFVPYAKEKTDFSIIHTTWFWALPV